MFPAVNPTINLLQCQVLCKATRCEAYLQNEPLTMDRLYLYGENDAKTMIFNFQSCLRLNLPKVMILTVKINCTLCGQIIHSSSQSCRILLYMSHLKMMICPMDIAIYFSFPLQNQSQSPFYNFQSLS